MRTYEAIEKVSQTIIADNTCEAILIKGSIGRGDDDAYSDVDMYVVVSEENMVDFLEKRTRYLEAYKQMVYIEQVHFVAPQIVAIYNDGLHFDLYTVTQETLAHTDPVKIIYDPKNLFEHYEYTSKQIDFKRCASLFNEVLYYFVEADGAYKRENYPWTSAILMNGISACAVLMRYLYDKDYAYLGLKKINEVIPEEQYLWIEEACENLGKDGYQKANQLIIRMLEYVNKHIESQIRDEFNHEFFVWVKANLGSTLFE